MENKLKEAIEKLEMEGYTVIHVGGDVYYLSNENIAHGVLDEFGFSIRAEKLIDYPNNIV
jgi:hypothetical protein